MLFVGAHSAQINANRKRSDKLLVSSSDSSSSEYSGYFKCVGNYADGLLESISVVDGSDPANQSCGKCFLGKAVLDVPSVTLSALDGSGWYVHVVANYNDSYSISVELSIEERIRGGLAIAFVDENFVINQYWQQLDAMNFNSIFWVKNV